MRDLHVALISPWQRHGGIATYSERFAAALRENGMEVTPVPIVDSASANPFRYVDLVSRIPDGADVVHVQFEAGVFGKLGMTGVGAPAFFLALNRIEQPVVTTLHEVHSTHPHRGTIGDYLLRGRDLAIERLALRASDATIVHTKQARQVLENRHSDEWRIERMLHPADADVSPIPQSTAKEQLDVAGRVLLTFGFVEAKKRYQDVIRVLPELPEATYVIAGGLREAEGEEVMSECQNLAAELGVSDRVRFTGYVEDDEVSVVFSAADAVVLPYERVSQSGVVNDALAYQRPVVASSLPAFEELREEFGCLLTYGNEPELALALETVLYDEEEQTRLRNTSTEYLNVVNWEGFAARTQQIYADVTATKCSSSDADNPE